jgi:hypothetical protein
MTNPLSSPSRPPARTLWKPIGLTLVATLVLALFTCGGGFAVGKGPDGLGSFLLYTGLLFVGLFLLTLLFAAVYLIVWLIQKPRSQ